MSICKVEKNKNYTVMGNFHLQDKRLSLKAVGLMSKILSLPSTWNYTVKGLCSICKENMTAINSALEELKQNGYLVVIKHRPSESNGGRWTYEYNFYEQPIQKQEQEILGIENLYLENVGIENLAIENMPLYKDTKQLNTNIESTNIENKENFNKNLSKAELKLLAKKEQVKKDNEKVLETCLSQFDCFSEKVIDKLFSWKEVIDERNNKQDYSKDLFNFISSSIETMLNNLSILTQQEQIKRIENSIANPKYNTIYTNNLFETNQTNKAPEPSSGRTKEQQSEIEQNNYIKTQVETRKITPEQALQEYKERLEHKSKMKGNK